MHFHIEPGDVPPDAAARRLGLSLAEFERKLESLLARGFPRCDPDTGRYDLDAIDAWRKTRHPHLFGDSTPMQARDAAAVAKDRIARLRR